jgi:hypothetical protein
MHVEDLIDVERELGYRYELEDREVQHYQWICPRCRRLLLSIAQANEWAGVRGGGPLLSDLPNAGISSSDRHQ